MGNRRTLIAAAAIVLAIAAGAGVYMYVSGADSRAEAKVQLVDAYVASGDIPKGTTGDAALSDGLISPAHVLRKILGHLGLPTDPPAPLPARPPPSLPDLFPDTPA